MTTVRKIVYAYEILFMKRMDDSTSQEVWDSGIMEELLDQIFTKDKQDRATRKDDEWVMYLDDITKDDADKYIVGLFKSTRFGYKTPLLHGVNLTERENPREREEGEQIHTHFYLRKSDGFLLLEAHFGSQNIVNRGKLEEYLEQHGQAIMNRHNVTSIKVGTLLSAGFFEEIKKLTKVSEALLEIRTKDQSATEGQSDTYKVLMDHSNKLKGNAVQMIVKARHDKTGLLGIHKWVDEVKDLKGFSAISIRGKEGEIDRVINLEKNIEKHFYPHVDANDDRMVSSGDLYDKMISTGVVRSEIR